MSPVQQAMDLVAGKLTIMGKRLDDFNASDLVNLLDKPELNVVAIAYRMQAVTLKRALADEQVTRYGLERDMAEFKMNVAKDRRASL